MKKLLAVLLVLGLAFAGMASYYAGVEIIPHTFGAATYGISYVIVGYEAPMAFTHVGLSSPLTINGWYMLKAGGNYALTDNLKLAGYFALWGELTNFALSNGTWAIGFGINYKFDSALAFFLNFNLPLAVDPATPYWGFWSTLGFKFYFGSELGG